MKKTLKLLGKILLLLVFIPVTFILLLFNASVWIRVPPPASALFTMPKLLYPNIVNTAVVVYAVLIVIVAAILVLNRYKGFLHSALVRTVMIIFMTALSCSLVSSLAYIGVITHANVEYAAGCADTGKAEENGTFDRNHRLCVDLSQGFPDEKPAAFKLYMPDGSGAPRDVVMYLAYGNWLAVPEHDVDYLVDHLTQKGYGAVVFTGRTRLDTDFTGMIKDIREKIAFLRSVSAQYGIRHIYLSGGSAGANLALIAAYAGGCEAYMSDGLSAQQTRVDGVIAFYPVVDMVYNYDYFTGKAEKDKSAFDRLGDAFFSLSDPNGAKAIDQSHRHVMKFLLGGPPDESDLKHMYEISSPNRFLSKDAPPTLFIQGSHDSMTPIEPTRAMYEDLKKMGADAAMLELPFTDHAFDMVMPDGSVVTAKVLEIIDEWLEDHKS